MRNIAIVGLWLLCVLACRAEPRWCTVTGRGPNDTLVYPPIARAARVSGIVLGRLVYTPAGKFIRFEPISGPKMLEAFLANQFEQWKILTDATGDELCQTLVIAEFRLDESAPSQSCAKVVPEVGSTLRFSVTAQPYVIDTVISDPAPLHGFKLFSAEAKWGLHRMFGWLTSKQ